ncbi:MAG: aromatic ring-hydroxylating dioxygenase subunit alpha [Alphaproteobacteria bacterium]|nr:aromatic ring-hydroxylating dioxygenase subunit alpha [Alphaproteobacteria bacterium]
MTGSYDGGTAGFSDKISSLAPALQAVAAEGSSVGLPNPCYMEADAWMLERETVFAKHWAGLGFTADIAKPGDCHPIDFLGQPLLMVRDKKGRARVFHNVCRHRGMLLVEKAGPSKGVLRCRYHSWAYDLEGRLKRTPYIGGPHEDTHPDFDPNCYGLAEVRAHEWLGVVWINLDGRAPAFEEANAKILERWREFAGAPLTHTGDDCRLQFELGTNWKLAIENYCEAYHLPWVHPALNSYSRIEDHYNIVEPGNFSGQGTTVYNPLLSPDGRKFPALSGLSSMWDAGAEYVSLYPNVMLGVHRDHCYAIVVLPDGPTRCRERLSLYYFDEAVRDPDYAELRATNQRTWEQVFVEDVFAVEGMQKGRASPGFDGGVFTPVMDPPTRCFHVWAAETMLEGPRPPEGLRAAAE